jgi:hypothetical protein
MIVSDLFALGQAHFQSVISRLKAEGIMVSPDLQLCASDGFLCYYDRASQAIYLSLPDRDTAQGRLQMILLRSLLNCASDAELIEFLRCIMGWLVAHEIAHHCRDLVGFLSENIWQEEQIANYLAIAVSKSELPTDTRLWCDTFLTRSVQNLASKQVAGSSAVDSYHSLPHSLYVAGVIDAHTFEEIDQIREQTGYLSEMIVKNRLVSDLPANIEDRVHNRHQNIKRINAGAHRHIFQHLYYYFGWMQIGLMSEESYPLHTFKTQFLDDTSPYFYQTWSKANEC